MRRATSATLLLRLAAACDNAMTVPAAIDGKQIDLRFRRDESLLGQGLAYAMCHSLRTPKGCEGLCAAQALADRARAAFLTSGCGALSLDKRFDVLQVGAHVGNSRDDANRLLDPVFAWLRTAPAHASVLLVEPMCVVRVRNFKLPSRHASAIDATTTVQARVV